MATIERLVLRNFRRFKTLELAFDPELNILVGGNEAGKSSVLQALDIVLSASRSKVEALGLETLFNAECIAEFLDGERKIADLPEGTHAVAKGCACHILWRLQLSLPTRWYPRD